MGEVIWLNLMYLASMKSYSKTGRTKTQKGRTEEEKRDGKGWRVGGGWRGKGKGGDEKEEWRKVPVGC